MGRCSPHTFAHRCAHRSQQKDRGRHGDEPQGSVEAEHGQAHQQDRAKEEHQIGDENLVAHGRAELDWPGIVHDDHEGEENEVDGGADAMQPTGAGADECHQHHRRRDAEGEHHVSQDVVDVHAPRADTGEEANPLEDVDEVDDNPGGESRPPGEGSELIHKLKLFCEIPL